MRCLFCNTVFKGDFNDGSGDNNNATCTEETCIGWDREADSDYDDSDESAGPKEQAEEPNADRPTETSAPAKVCRAIIPQFSVLSCAYTSQDQSDNYRGEVASRPQKVIHIHDAA